MSTNAIAHKTVEQRLADRYALQFVALKAQGLTQAEIARRYGISRQRVWQILKRAHERGLLLKESADA